MSEQKRDGPHPDWIRPGWPAPAGVAALITTRPGGCSTGPWGLPDGPGGCNLGQGQDDAAAVARNRKALAALLPAEPVWMQQVHGTEVIDASRHAAAQHAVPVADAAYTTQAGVVCCVRVADCLPVLLADARGRGVAAAHAGWRGLAGGVVQAAAGALRAALGDPDARLLAFLGPAIGPAHFEVGPEVFEAMRARLPGAATAFRQTGSDRYHADLFALGRQALAACAVTDVYGGGLCTYADPQRFYSYRRDRVTGRHAALIWRTAAIAADTKPR